MNVVELFTKTNSALNDIVQQVDPEKFNLTIPSYAAYYEGQTLRTHINICAYENDCVPKMLAGEHVPPNKENTKDYLQDDFKANFAQLTETANQAVLSASETDLDRTVHMSYGDAAARSYLSDIVLQRSAAAIDIAQVAGVSFTWPQDMLQAIWDIAEPIAPTLRQYGIFPEAVSIDADAPLQDRLIALMGHKP